MSEGAQRPSRMVGAPEVGRCLLTGATPNDWSKAPAAASPRRSEIATRPRLCSRQNASERQRATRSERAGGAASEGQRDAYGGVLGVTKGLIGEFGESRVIDTPITESGVMGAAAGAPTREAPGRARR